MDPRRGRCPRSGSFSSRSTSAKTIMFNRSSHPQRSIVSVLHFLIVFSVFLAGLAGDLSADVDLEARARAVEAHDAGRTGEAHGSPPREVRPRSGILLEEHQR